jgi:hypothetical protein
MSQAKTLLEEVSPHGNVQAVVEQDDRVVHFYLWGGRDSSFGTRSCWVRNLKPAPTKLEVTKMRDGAAPMLPRAQCRHPEGAPPLECKELSVVWFEEGDGAALLAGSSILAIIPGWSGSNGFHGYARDCIGEASLCWELDADNVLHQRVRAAADYWASWDATPSPWEAVQNGQLEAVEARLGAHEKYYASDGGNWPPKAMVRLRVPEGIAFVTIGVCLRPQPGVERAVENAADLRRIELGIALSATTSDDKLDRAAQYLSAQTNLPWNEFTWLGPGHTIPCDALDGFAAVLLTPAPPQAPDLALPAFRGDPVTLLWLLPITEAERRLAVDNGSDALLKRLAKAGHGWVHDR